MLHGDDMTPWAEAALYAAARAEHVGAVIRPALERGEDVVCDRYLDSSVAYQGAVRVGSARSAVRDLSLLVTGGLLPDRTFLVLLDPDEARRRSGEHHDRIEREGDDFMRASTRATARSRPPSRSESSRSTARAREEIAEEVREHVRPLL